MKPPEEGEEGEEEYSNPMIAELRTYQEDCLKIPTLDHEELDQGETDEDEIHVIQDKKLRVNTLLHKYFCSLLK